MAYVVKLSRTAIEIAAIEVEATNEIEAANIAFKEIDRHKDKPQDKRVKLVDLTLKADAGSIWEELGVEKV